MKKYSIIIPAAGQGLRMKGHGPISLLPIRNTTIIENQLRVINKRFHNFKEIILITGLYSKKVMDATPNNIIKIENVYYETTNVMKSIGIGLRACTTNRILIIYGDLVFNISALKTSFDKSCIIMAKNTMSNNEIGATIINGKLSQLSYDLPHKWAQIVFLTGKELKLLKQIIWDYEKNTWFGFETINAILSKGGSFDAIQPPRIKVNDIDTLADLQKAQNLL